MQLAVADSNIPRPYRPVASNTSSAAAEQLLDRWPRASTAAGCCSDPRRRAPRRTSPDPAARREPKALDFERGLIEVSAARAALGPAPLHADAKGAAGPQAGGRRPVRRPPEDPPDAGRADAGPLGAPRAEAATLAGVLLAAAGRRRARRALRRVGPAQAGPHGRLPHGRLGRDARSGRRWDGPPGPRRSVGRRSRRRPRRRGRPELAAAARQAVGAAMPPEVGEVRVATPSGTAEPPGQTSPSGAASQAGRASARRAPAAGPARGPGRAHGRPLPDPVRLGPCGLVLPALPGHAGGAGPPRRARRSDPVDARRALGVGHRARTRRPATGG